LRVGVIASIPHATIGGGSTFLESLVQVLDTMQNQHVFVRFKETPDGHKAGAVGLRRNPNGHLTHLRTMARETWLGDKLARSARMLRGSHPQNQRQIQIDQWIRMQQIDIVWFLHPMATLVSVPYIATVWDLQHRSRPYFPEVSVTGWNWEAREQSYSAILPRASFILTGTHAGKNEIVHYYRVNPDNVIVNPLPAPSSSTENHSDAISDIRKKYGIRADFLIYPAQFWPHKNHINLLIALAILNRKIGKTIDMVFTGSDKGNADHVLEKINELGLHDQVHMLGFVPREDLKALYSKARALTFPSFFGPDNIPPLEAFALGCPVTASRVSGAEEQLGDAALLFDPANPDDIASAILTILEDDQLRARMTQKGADIAKVRTPQAYVALVCTAFDKFDPIRRCWGRDYKHL
jgi:glycosyltransferase involved in cell wall biosynthesis